MNLRFERRSRGALALWLVSALLLVQACASSGSRTPVGDEAELDLIAQNLVYTLAQLDGMNPLNTTVQLSEPQSVYGRSVVARVREVGYGVQNVAGDRGGNYLRYRIQRTTSELAEETRYAVSIGDVSVERAYERRGGRLVPISEQRVRGAAEAGTVELNDSLFALDADAVVSSVVFDEDIEPMVVDVASGEPERPGASGSTTILTFGEQVKKNLYGRIGSNYAEVFVDYDDVEQDSVVFGNDSMRLGAAQKELVRAYAARFRPDTDLISIVGCSHGRTAIDNGNSVLALGRANRVKEALVYAGLSPEAVLDEGCWADQYHSEFPKRGVIMTLKRRRD